VLCKSEGPMGAVGGREANSHVPACLRTRVPRGIFWLEAGWGGVITGTVRRGLARHSVTLYSFLQVRQEIHVCSIPVRGVRRGHARLARSSCNAGPPRMAAPPVVRRRRDVHFARARGQWERFERQWAENHRPACLRTRVRYFLVWKPDGGG